jgi:hypothetical protein
MLRIDMLDLVVIRKLNAPISKGFGEIAQVPLCFSSFSRHHLANMARLIICSVFGATTCSFRNDQSVS